MSGSFPFNLTISTVAGQSLKIRAFGTDSISDVKNEIENLYGIPAESQILICRDQVLENDLDLHRYSIDQKSSISLAIKVRNGIRSMANASSSRDNNFILLCKRDSRYFILEMTSVNQRLVLKSIKPIKQDKLKSIETYLSSSSERSRSSNESAMFQEETYSSSQTSTVPSYLSSSQIRTTLNNYQQQLSKVSLLQPPSTLRSSCLAPSINASNCCECGKRLGLTNSYKCKCGGSFCPKHRFNDQHRCNYDYRAEGKRDLEQRMLSKNK